MSRSKQDSLLLEERIEKIRRKNEEIKRRHLEVEADKQNAAKLNALVQLTSPTEEWPVRGRSPSPPPPRSGSRQFEQNGPRQSGGSGSGKIYIFGEGDGPPPDPAYKFLADSERDVQLPRRGRNAGRSRGTGTRDRDKGRGGGMPRPEYEAWRAERNRIDSDRINRQKTAEGHWRREWDNEKMSQEEEEPRPVRRSQRGRNSDWNTYRDNTTRMAAHDERTNRATTERGTRGMSRGNIHGRRVNQVQQSSSSDVAEESYIPANSERSVVSVGESIKISVSNSPPVRRVKVNAPVIGGTGRVGPRQKIIVSYSSQSEDEAPRSHVVERQVSISSSSRPPLPPSTGPKLDNPKPRRQRTKRPDNGRMQGPRKDDTCVKNEEEKENRPVEVSQKENESGGDDSWEDVATTSGNESACEELSPVSKIVDAGDSEGTKVDEHDEDRSSSEMLTPIIITQNGDLNSNVEQTQLDTSESSERIGDQQQ